MTRRVKARRRATPKHVVTATKRGGVTEFFDDCPICRALAASGEPVFGVDAKGELVELKPRRN